MNTQNLKLVDMKAAHMNRSLKYQLPSLSQEEEVYKWYVFVLVYLKCFSSLLSTFWKCLLTVLFKMNFEHSLNLIEMFTYSVMYRINNFNSMHYYFGGGGRIDKSILICILYLGSLWFLQINQILQFCWL